VGAQVIFVDRSYKLIFGNETTTGRSKESHYGFHEVTASIDLGFGILRQMNDKLALSVQPMARYYPFSLDSTSEANFYNFGIEIGASYSLNKK